jgi:hypothetical protein
VIRVIQSLTNIKYYPASGVLTPLSAGTLTVWLKIIGTAQPPAAHHISDHVELEVDDDVDAALYGRGRCNSYITTPTQDLFFDI